MGLGGHQARGIAPVEFADRDGTGGEGLGGRGRWWVCGRVSAVVATLAAEATVGVAFGLLSLVVAVFDVVFGVVLLDPGDACPELVEGMCLVSREMLSPRRRSTSANSDWIRLTLLSRRYCRGWLGMVRSKRVK